MHGEDAVEDRLLRRVAGTWLAIGVLLLLAGAWLVLREPLSLVLPPVALALVVTYLLNPPVTAMRRRGVPRPLGAILAYLASGAMLAGLVLLVGPVLLEQGRGLLERLPEILVATEGGINRLVARAGLPATARVDLQGAGIVEAVRGAFTESGAQALDLLRGVGGVVGWVFHLALTLVLGPIIAFYALADLPRIRSGVGRLVPPGGRGELLEVSQRIGRLVGAYFRGQLLVATFVGTATAVGLLLVGLPFWALVGVVAGVFNLVPLVGPFAGGVLGVLVALTVGGGPTQALLVVLVMVAVQQVDNHVITPVVVSRSVAVHPITVVLALLVAGSIGGIPLLFVAIPVTAALKLVLLQVLVTRVPAMQHLAGEARDLPDPPARATLGALALELRRAFDRVRGQGVEGDRAGPPGGSAGDGAGADGGTGREPEDSRSPAQVD